MRHIVYKAACDWKSRSLEGVAKGRGGGLADVPWPRFRGGQDSIAKTKPTFSVFRHNCSSRNRNNDHLDVGELDD